MRSIKLLDKRGLAIGDMYPIVLTIVLIGIVLGVGFYVLAQFRDQLTSGSTEWKAVNTTITGLNKFPTWIAIVVVVAAAAIVLGVVVGSFAAKRRGI